MSEAHSVETSWRACGRADWIAEKQKQAAAAICHLPSSPQSVPRYLAPTACARPALLLPLLLYLHPSLVARRSLLAAQLPPFATVVLTAAPASHPPTGTCHPRPAPLSPLLSCSLPSSAPHYRSLGVPYPPTHPARIAPPSTPARHGDLSSGPPLDGSTEHSSLHHPR